jgi:AI-2 transport protein TqsA
MTKVDDRQPGGAHRPPAPSRAPTPQTTALLTVIGIGVGVGLAVLLAVVMRALGSIIKPFFIAVFLCILIYPAVGFFVRIRVPRVLAYLIVFIVIGGLFYVLGILVSINVASFIERLPFYEQRLTAITDRVLSIAQRVIALDRWGLTSGINFSDFNPFQYISLDKITAYIGSSIGSVVDIVGSAFVVIFFMVFILMEVDRFPARVRWAYGDEKAPAILAVSDDINRSVMKYLWVKTFINVATGLLTALVLVIAGVDFWILWGILAFLLNYIPYVGSIFAILLPALMALVQLSPLAALVILGVLIALHFVLGNFIEPKAMGRELNLSPLVVLIALAFWGWLWGFIGLVLAIPITATIKIVMEHIPATRNFARFMSDVLEIPTEHPGKKRRPIVSLFSRAGAKAHDEAAGSPRQRKR